MTKSEAKAIHESANRALRVLNGVEWSKAGIPLEVRDVVVKTLEQAADEIGRISAMAWAELSK